MAWQYAGAAGDGRSASASVGSLNELNRAGQSLGIMLARDRRDRIAERWADYVACLSDLDGCVFQKCLVKPGSMQNDHEKSAIPIIHTLTSALYQLH